MKHPTLILLLLLCSQKTNLPAQNPAADSIWLEAKNLRICLRADGSLHSGSKGGAVQYRHQTMLGEKWVNVVQDAGLWFGGIDPAGNLKLSVQNFELQASDFRSGLPNVAGSNKFWQVSRAEITQHLADYSEDAIIDHPIAAIFAWPGYKNRFFKEYNGFDLPNGFYANNANFYDHNYNGIYDPDKGEFPIYLQPPQGYGRYFPEQITAFLFHTDPSPVPTYGRFPVSGLGYAYSFDCSASPVFDNSIFFAWDLQFTGPERADSFLLGYYINPDIGNPNDDYQGSNGSTYFAYNADSLYDARFGLQPPVLSVQAFNVPRTEPGTPTTMRVMPVGKPHSIDPGAMPAMGFPEHPVEYFNYLSSHWRDGRPLTAQGNGYFTNAAIAQTAFPGNPYAPGLWTEVNANNLRGDRRAVLSWNYNATLPGSRHQLGYYLTVHPGDDNSETQVNKFDNIFSELNKVRGWFDGNPVASYSGEDCLRWPWYNFERFLIRCYPNPVSDVLNIQMEGGQPFRIRLFDVHQRMVADLWPSGPFEDWWDWGNPAQLPVGHLPPGVYYLEAGSRYNIHTSVQKIIVLH